MKGTYVSVEPFNLFCYLDEQAYRLNNRRDNDQARFMMAQAQITENRLTNKHLRGEDAEPGRTKLYRGLSETAISDPGPSIIFGWPHIV